MNPYCLSPLSFSSSYTSSNGMLTCSAALISMPPLFSSSIFFLNVQLLYPPLLVASSASWVFTSWEECCTGNWTMVPTLMMTPTTTTTKQQQQQNNNNNKTTTTTTTYATLVSEHSFALHLLSHTFLSASGPLHIDRCFTASHLCRTQQYNYK